MKQKEQVKKMALHIMKDNAFLKALPLRYEEYATVKSLRRVGLKKYFGPRAGTVWASHPQGPSHPVFQVVVPEWKDGKGEEWELLCKSYEKLLQLAEEHHCKAVVIPLLEENDPRFPAYIDFEIAVDTIRAFQETHNLDVFLQVSRPVAFQMPELRQDIDRFLNRNYSEWEPQWSSLPFESTGDRFITLAPEPSEVYEEASSGGMWSGYGEGMWLEDCAPSPSRSCSPAQEYSASWEEEDEDEELPRKAMQRSRKKPVFPAMHSRKERVADQHTGRLPEIPDLDNLDAGFSETLLKLIDKTGKKDSEIYNKANVSRQHFSKIRNNPDYKPTKPTAIAFAIALELDMKQTEDLIGRAGYTLTRSSKFDVIIMYFIQKRNYNMFDINETLYEYDQSLLGA